MVPFQVNPRRRWIVPSSGTETGPDVSLPVLNSLLPGTQAVNSPGSRTAPGEAELASDAAGVGDIGDGDGCGFVTGLPPRKSEAPTTVASTSAAAARSFADELISMFLRAGHQERRCGA